DPRGIYAPALLVNAAYAVLFHTHPSGDPSPSREDQAMTEKVAAAGKVLAIPLLDHLILGESSSYVSLSQLGRMP
ncbi:MAG: DNA repair protein RadC, partial [Gammaproteobacteria bacterium]|nr:DNA repair protein RadC [Gammaproteobacteria bacterium]